MLNSYPWYISDWRDSETRLAMSAAARGIYRELLDYCWLEGSLPTDSDTLVKLSAVTKREFTVHWPRIKQCFKEVDGRLHNTKVDEKRPFVLQAKEDRQRGAERANEIIRARRLANAERNAERTLSSDAERTPPPTPSPSPTPLLKEEADSSPKPDFKAAAQAIWECWLPKRRPTAAIIERYLRARIAEHKGDPFVDLEFLVKNAKAYNESEGEFAKGADVWFGTKGYCWSPIDSASLFPRNGNGKLDHGVKPKLDFHVAAPRPANVEMPKFEIPKGEMPKGEMK
jgi:uncharacterized protein YdaU (DUF1376 family)